MREKRKNVCRMLPFSNYTCADKRCLNMQKTTGSSTHGATRASHGLCADLLHSLEICMCPNQNCVQNLPNSALSLGLQQILLF